MSLVGMIFITELTSLESGWSVLNDIWYTYPITHFSSPVFIAFVWKWHEWQQDRLISSLDNYDYDLYKSTGYILLHFCLKGVDLDFHIAALCAQEMWTMKKPCYL